MEFLLWGLIGILVLIILGLCIKIALMRKSACEIEAELTERLLTKTNTLIDISSHDRSMKKLAASMNTQLRKLRSERQRFEQGDLELKEAVTNISHDLRTPLTAICGYLDLLAQEEKSETVQRYFEMIHNRTEVMKQLTEELFRYSVMLSVSDEKKEHFVMNALLEESLASYYGAFMQRQITPEIVMPERSVECCLDRSALRRVFENIISNALKYSDGDFSVTMQEDGQITFSNTAKELTPVTAGRLFDRFFTVETGRNSTGLGLSIAKLLTERMGGSISADYREGRLSILLKLPCVK